MLDEHTPDLLPSPDSGNESKMGMFIALPEDVAVSDVRDNLAASQQLFFQIEREDPEDLTPLRFGYGADEYELHPGVRYVVGLGGRQHGMLYLNPLQPQEEVPDESNIPLAADRQLSTEKVRQRAGLRLLVASPDGDILKALNEIEDFKRYEQAHQRFEELVEKAGGEEQIVSLLRSSADRHGLEGIDTGQGFSNLLPYWFEINAASEFVARVKAGQPESDPLALIEQESAEFFSWLQEVVLPRVSQLEAELNDPNTIAFAFDEYLWDESEPDVTSLIVTTYIPGTGWSVASPNADCPNQAANALDNWMKGQVGKDEFPHLISSIEKAESAGDLEIDTDRRLLVFKNLDALRSNYAVYHGDDSLAYALETLKGMGDPTLGESLFNFKQILFLDTTEFDERPNEHVQIDFD